MIDRAHVLAHLYGAARDLPAAVSLPLPGAGVAEAKAGIVATVFRGIWEQEGALAACEAVRPAAEMLRRRIDQAGLTAPLTLRKIEGLIQAADALPVVWPGPA